MLASALWTRWSVDPSVALLGVTVGLWVWGGRQTHVTHARRRGAAFWGGVLALVVALNSPVDSEADHLFWVHMVQHVLLLTVAPPLLVLGRPMPRVLRALPSGLRLRVVREVRRGRWGVPLRWVARPWIAWTAFCAVLVVWHLPGLYDTALRVQAVHDLEHLTFIATGLLFWNHALAIPPFATSLDPLRRAVYSASAMIVGWLLAIALAVAPHPLYSFYSAQLSRPGGISALTDQQLAAGVMWVPGSVAFTIAIVLAVYRWLDPTKRSVVPARPTVS